MQNVLESQEDYETYLADSGSTGIQLAFEIMPGLILCDIMMEGIDGYKVFQVLKESHFTSHIPFIFLTGRSSREDIRAGMNLGADDYIIKPFDNEDLLKAVEIQLLKYERRIDSNQQSIIAMLEASPLASFLYTETGIVKINKAFHLAFGYKENEIFGKELIELMPHTERDKYKGIFQLVSKGVIKEYKTAVSLFNSRYKIINGSVQCRMISDFRGINIVLGIFNEESNAVVNPDEGQQDSDTELQKKLQFKRNIRLGAEKKSHLADDIYLATPDYENDVAVKDLFSARELEVLSMAAKGLSTKEIADRLFISDRTVEKHRANMMAKIQAANIVEVIIYAVKNNMICV